MKTAPRLLALLPLLLLGFAGPAGAQYMRITTDNPGDPTRVRSTGTTILTITLDTSHDRNGSPQTCNSHTAACGAPGTPQPLDMFSYTVTLSAVGGSVQWGTFTAADASYTPIGTDLADNAQTEFNRARPPGTVTPPGLSTLGSIPVTILSGAPAVQIAHGQQQINPFGFGTGFGTDCDGSLYPNTYVLGDPADICGTGDWLDADAASAPAQVNTQPVITAPATASGAEGSTFSISATATDPDAGEILCISVTGQPPGVPFSTVCGPSPLTATLTGTPGYNDAGSYVVRWTVTDHLGLGSQATTSLFIANTDRAPTLNPIANMSSCGSADQAISGSDPDGDALTFSKQAGPTFMTVTTTSPTTGSIHIAPGFSDGGTYPATVRASDGSLSSDQSFFIDVRQSCRAPVLNAVADMTVVEGMTADQSITASDPEGNPLTFSKASGPIFMTVSTVNPGPPNASGTIHLAPGLADAGTYTAAARATSTDGLSDTKTFTITVRTSGNRCPTANPDGPYSGIVGVPVSFDGSASSDPDGNPLTYAWDFDASDGIGVDAVGVTASHAYALAGNFTVTLAVTDNGDGDPAQVCTVSATTTATIRTACDATVFNGYDTIRLGSGKPFWFAYVQPATGCYANTDVVTSSFVMKYAGRQVSAEATKTTVGGDKSGDGIQEIKVSWSKDNLRTLFTGTGLANGHNTVTVTLEADLITGGKLRGTTQLDVVNNGSFTISAVAPNPLNPEATLTYTTSRQGPVRIDMFDIQGRLVRRLVDAPAMAAGTHEAKIDGRGERGEKLPSGVYYIRGRSSEGAFKNLVTILK